MTQADESKGPGHTISKCTVYINIDHNKGHLAFIVYTCSCYSDTGWTTMHHWFYKINTLSHSDVVCQFISIINLFVLFKELLCFVPQFVTVIHTKRI